MRHPQVALAAGLVCLSLLAGAPALAQVAETIQVSIVETSGGGGAASRRPSRAVLIVFALPGMAGSEASDRRLQKVRGDWLNQDARLFTIDEPTGTISREAANRARPYRGYEGAAWFEVDEAGLLDDGPRRGGIDFLVR